jgi:hypothetical protein
MSSTSGPNFITPGLSVNIVIVRRKSALLQRKGSSGRSRRRAPLAVGFCAMAIFGTFPYQLEGGRGVTKGIKP